VVVRGGVSALRDDQLVHGGLPGTVLMPDELFHLHVVTAFLQESDCGDRPDVGRIHAGQRGNSRGPLTFLRSRSRMEGQILPTPRHAMRNAATPSAPRRGPSSKIGVQSTGTLYGVIRTFTRMPENMLAANTTSRAMTHPPAARFSRSEPPRRGARNWRIPKSTPTIPMVITGPTRMMVGRMSTRGQKSRGQ